MGNEKTECNCWDFEEVLTMDIIQYEILEDGTVSIKTDKISKVNHFSADELLNDLEMELGGKRTTDSVKNKKAHVHNKKHVHA